MTWRLVRIVWTVVDGASAWASLAMVDLWSEGAVLVNGMPHALSAPFALVRTWGIRTERCWLTARSNRLRRDNIVGVLLLSLQAAQQRLLVDNQVDRAGAIGGQLTENNVLRDTSERVMLAEEGSLEQDLGSLFKTALAKRTTIDSIDTVTRDRSEDPTLSHHVHQGAQMPIVDIDGICAENHTQLFHETISGSLDTKHL